MLNSVTILGAKPVTGMRELLAGSDVEVVGLLGVTGGGGVHVPGLTKGTDAGVMLATKLPGPPGVAPKGSKAVVVVPFNPPFTFPVTGPEVNTKPPPPPPPGPCRSIKAVRAGQVMPPFPPAAVTVSVPTLPPPFTAITITLPPAPPPPPPSLRTV